MMIYMATGMLISMLWVAWSPWSLMVIDSVLIIILCFIAIYLFCCQASKSDWCFKHRFYRYLNFWMFLGMLIGGIYLQIELQDYRQARSIIPTTQMVTFNVEKVSNTDSYYVRILQSDNALLNHYYAQLFSEKRLVLGNTYKASLHFKVIQDRKFPGRPSRIYQQVGKRLIAYANLSNPEKLELIKNADWMMKKRIKIDEYLEANYSKASAFLSALSVGITKGLTDKDWSMYRRLGVVHLMAISGLHLSIVAGFVFLSSRFLFAFMLHKTQLHPFQFAAFTTCVVAFLYADFVGFAIPIQRALFMCIVAMIFLIRKRNILQFDVLATAVVVIVLFEPFSVFMIGFWLSFAAVFFLVWQQKMLGGVERSSFLNVLLSMQIFLSIMLMPLILYFFGEVSLVSPLANFLAIPMVALFILPMLLLGCVFLLMHYEFLADVFFTLSQWGMIKLNDAFALLSKIPFLSSALSSFGALLQTHLFVALFLNIMMLWLFVQMMAFYQSALKGVNALKNFFNLMKSMILIFIAFSMILLFQSRYKEHAIFSLYVFPVGEGLSVLLKNKERAYLFDTGPYQQNYMAAERVILPALNVLGVEALQGLILSHDDSQHTGGARSIMRSKEIKTVYTTIELQKFIFKSKSCNEFHIKNSFLQLTPLTLESSCAYSIKIGKENIWLLADITVQEWEYLWQTYPSPSWIIYPNQGRSSRYVLNDFDGQMINILFSTAQPNQKLMDHLKNNHVYNAQESTIAIHFDEQGFKVEDFSMTEFWWQETLNESKHQK